MLTLTIYFSDANNKVSSVDVENVTYHEYFVKKNELNYVVDGRQKFRVHGDNFVGFVANPVNPITPKRLEA